MNKCLLVFGLGLALSLGACSQTRSNQSETLRQTAISAWNVSPTAMTVQAGSRKTGKVTAWLTTPGDWVDIAFANAPSGITINGGGRIAYGRIKSRDFTVSVEGTVVPDTYDIDVTALDNDGNYDYKTLTITVNPLPKGGIFWGKQIGTSQKDMFTKTNVDKLGNVLVAGFNYGTGSTANLVLAKYAPDGTELWTKQTPATFFDHVQQIGVDGDNNIIVIGSGKVGSGTGNVFIAKYRPNGELIWANQLGDPLRSDRLIEFSIDSKNNIVLVGQWGKEFFTDGFVTKFDPDGKQLWIKDYNPLIPGRYSLPHEISQLAVDQKDNIVVAGSTSSPLGGTHKGKDDVFFIKYGPDGGELWKKQLGSAENEYINDLFIDSTGNVTMVGVTEGSISIMPVIVPPIHRGGLDISIAKFDPDGDLILLKQYGTTEDDRIVAAAMNAKGEIAISGTTKGSWFSTFMGGEDSFLAKFGFDGALSWGKQFASSSFVWIKAVSIDQFGNALATGSTITPSFGSHFGDGDVFVAEYGLTGSQLWSKQFGSSVDDTVMSFVVDSVNSVTVVGFTKGKMFATPHMGDEDSFIARLKR